VGNTYARSLFIFRRDLRLFDNTGLLALLEKSNSVIPAFIFDPRQCDRKENPYFSEAAFQFLLNSLAELDETLKKKSSRLYVFSGAPEAVVISLIQKDAIEAVFVNKDYTPFSRKRDKEIQEACEKGGAVFEQYDDATLSPIETIRTQEGNVYTVFTPFMKNARAYAVPDPQENTYQNYFNARLSTKEASLTSFSGNNKGRTLALSGGRSEALNVLKRPLFLNNYNERRNRPDIPEGTSRLSAHHKFGTISIRETYHVAVEKLGKDASFVSELYWRDFYYYTAYHFPNVFKESFLPWARNIIWENDEEQFVAWCQGKTGVPIVDAGMRQLNATGYMHNRPRMIVASYLTKNLLIDWKWGERYFASKLIDYDPSQNNGGWQWSASVGTDPRPLRIFNPYAQAKEYDPDATYIKTWVPELSKVPASLLTDGNTQDFSRLAKDYPAPLVDQKKSYHRAQETYRKAKQTFIR
jgi:deoxyribodipyrimidine photo-lyase